MPGWQGARFTISTFRERNRRYPAGRSSPSAALNFTTFERSRCCWFVGTSGALLKNNTELCPWTMYISCVPETVAKPQQEAVH